MRHFATTIIKDDLLTQKEKEVKIIAQDEEKHIYHAGKFVNQIKRRTLKSRKAHAIGEVLSF